MHLKSKIVSAAVLLMLLAGCGGGNDHSDLDRFMEQANNQPVGEIEPLPIAKPYKTYAYSALTLRSPFDPPITLIAERQASGKSTVKPDESRQRELLERVTFASLSMVGTLARDNQNWSLINDGAGGIHRVKVGNYLGKNHGRIVSISPAQVDVIEIVPDGKGGWVERPRILSLKETE